MLTRSRTYRPSLWARLFLVDNWKLMLDQANRHQFRLGKGDALGCMGVSAVAVTKALLWHTVEIRTHTRTQTLSGLTGDGARRLRNDLVGFINLHLSDLIEQGKPSFGDACRQVLCRLDAFLSTDPGRWRTHDGHRLKVLVLWRYNLLNPFQGQPPRYDHIEVSGLSFHRSKGLEADYTILLDVSEGDYGVPSRIEDDELLNLVIPRPEAFPYAEERRLFYVALTRASRGTFLIYNRLKPSPYIAELRDIAGDDLRFETVDGARLQQCPKCVVGRLVERTTEDGTAVTSCSRHPSCAYELSKPSTTSGAPSTVGL